MSGQFTNRNLIRGLLQLDDLLVDKCRLLMHNEVWVERTLGSRIVLNSLARALAREGYASEATEDRHRLLMLAVSALQMQFCRFGRHDRSADNDTGNSDQPGNGHGIKITNGDVLGVGVKQQLMFGQLYITVVREEDSVGALF